MHKFNYRTFCVILVFFMTLESVSVFSISPTYSSQGQGKKDDKPWLTGPLLTPSSRVVPPGHYNIEPYLYWTVFSGNYGSHWEIIRKRKFYELTAQIVFKIGFLEGIAISGVVQGFRNSTRGKTAYAFGDLPLGLEFELYKGKNWFWKFAVQESIPTGRYQKLDSDKFGVEAGGTGSYATQISLTIGNLHHFSGTHFLSSRFNFAYTIPSSVHVKGLNVYGGDPSTRGRVFPGNVFSFLYGVEYTLTRNWALAFDLAAFTAEKTEFQGRTLFPVNSPSAVQLSIAPAIEYNWSEAMGIIAGTWFTIAGRNSNRFFNSVIAYNYNF